MAFFPNSIMPKNLAKEDTDVQESPFIYNANDYNVHHREILSIEKTLADNQGIAAVLSQIESVASMLANGSLFVSSSGILASGEMIQLPTGIHSTKITAPHSSSATTINVTSTANFPKSGILTKFNPNNVVKWCSGGGPPSGGSCGGEEEIWEYSNFTTANKNHLTNVEFIRYLDKTDTAFLSCTRGYLGTDAMPVNSPDNATIVSGRASLMLSPLSLTCSASNALNEVITSQFFVAHTADLIVTAGAMTKEATLADITDKALVSYMVCVLGHFEDVAAPQV